MPFDGTLLKRGTDSDLLIINHTHDKIHRKKFFDYQQRFLSVGNNATFDVAITATTEELHLIVTTNAEGKSYFDSYLNTTFTGGTDGAIFNRYIDDAPVSTAVIKEFPTVTATGTQRFKQLIIGGTGPQSTGKTQGGRIESVLAPGNTLLLRWTNKAGVSKDFGVEIEWYEEEPH